MIKSILKFSLTVFAFAAFTACSESTETTETPQESEETSQETVEPQEEEEVEVAPFAGLIGQWTVDAATAGVKMDLTFGEDGSFQQSMGPVQQEGTWTEVDEEHINIKTQNTKGDGQKWKVSNLTEESVDFTWNLDKNPKTIPMTRVK